MRSVADRVGAARPGAARPACARSPRGPRSRTRPASALGRARRRRRRRPRSAVEHASLDVLAARTRTAPACSRSGGTAGRWSSRPRRARSRDATPRRSRAARTRRGRRGPAGPSRRPSVGIQLAHPARRNDVAGGRNSIMLAPCDSSSSTCRCRTSTARSRCYRDQLGFDELWREGCRRRSAWRSRAARRRSWSTPTPAPGSAPGPIFGVDRVDDWLAGRERSTSSAGPSDIPRRPRRRASATRPATTSTCWTRHGVSARRAYGASSSRSARVMSRMSSSKRRLRLPAERRAWPCAESPMSWSTSAGRRNAGSIST